ncbi:YesL family protein [Bifidobacterium sp.]|jgi:uncharacterized membrane protein YesL|uniref:YesL family protein n=1 Tax=Bifidobacterium sp. TaxID=41200 RepID=UPI0025BD9323|nr:YesL family protein [Bifidobacterium sp.]MCI1634725.1 YesL family protein [Bifidobacterium sp.]
MGMFLPDSPFMRGLSAMVDAIWINVLLIVTSLPIVTVGAAMTAAHDAGRKSLEARGHVTANFFSSFKKNFVQSTLLWVPFALSGVVLVYAWIFLQFTPLLIVKISFSVIWYIAWLWVWALQARFENSVGTTLKNSVIIGISRAKQTVIMVIIDALLASLVVASWFLMPEGLFLLVLFGYGTLIMLHTPLLERGFAAWL